MKYSLLTAIGVLSFAASQAATSTSSDYPGQCSSTGGCEDYGSGYKCIAVDSSASGLENLNMCIAGDACSGNAVGACPTFSAWPEAYHVVQPLCVFVPADNCRNSTTGSGSAANGTIDCYERSFTVGNRSVTLDGFYSCVDRAKYLTMNPTNLTSVQLTNLTSSIAESCSVNTTTNTICSGQGTCALTTAAEQEFACECNRGYDLYANCSTVSSNECSSLGQCGTEGTCTVSSGQTTGTCTCSEGTTGDQCAKCDSTSAKACNAHGTCGSDGVCTCETGYSGTFCSEGGSSTSSKSSSDSSSTPSTSTSAASTQLPSMVALFVIAALVAFRNQ
ncbi:hypothetical protein FI667_g1859, partial [Globisporangium splendens]